MHSAPPIAREATLSTYMRGVAGTCGQRDACYGEWPNVVDPTGTGFAVRPTCLTCEHVRRAARRADCATRAASWSSARHDGGVESRLAAGVRGRRPRVPRRAVGRRRRGRERRAGPAARRGARGGRRHIAPQCRHGGSAFAAGSHIRRGRRGGLRGDARVPGRCDGSARSARGRADSYSWVPHRPSPLTPSSTATSQGCTAMNTAGGSSSRADFAGYSGGPVITTDGKVVAWNVPEPNYVRICEDVRGRAGSATCGRSEFARCVRTRRRFGAELRVGAWSSSRTCPSRQTQPSERRDATGNCECHR